MIENVRVVKYIQVIDPTSFSSHVLIIVSVAVPWPKAKARCEFGGLWGLMRSVALPRTRCRTAGSRTATFTSEDELVSRLWLDFRRNVASDRLSFAAWSKRHCWVHAHVPHSMAEANLCLAHRLRNLGLYMERGPIIYKSTHSTTNSETDLPNVIASCPSDRLPEGHLFVRPSIIPPIRLCMCMCVVS